MLKLLYIQLFPWSSISEIINPKFQLLNPKYLVGLDQPQTTRLILDWNRSRLLFQFPNWIFPNMSASQCTQGPQVKLEFVSGNAAGQIAFWMFPLEPRELFIGIDNNYYQLRNGFCIGMNLYSKYNHCSKSWCKNLKHSFYEKVTYEKVLNKSKIKLLVCQEIRVRF